MRILFLGLLGSCALEDWRKKQISIKLLGSLLVGGVMIVLQEQQENNVIGGVCIGMFLLALAFLTKAVGAADGLLVCATGLVLGFWRNLALVSAAVFASAVYALLLLMRRRRTGKDEIAFAPFLFLSYIWVVCYVR